MRDPSAIAEALKTEVAEFRSEVTRRNQRLAGLMLVVSLLFALNAYIAWTGRSASRDNGKVLSIIEQALNPDSDLRKLGLCETLVLHGLDGPDCAAVREDLIKRGALLP